MDDALLQLLEYQASESNITDRTEFLQCFAGSICWYNSKTHLAVQIQPNEEEGSGVQSIWFSTDFQYGINTDTKEHIPSLQTQLM